MLLSVIIPFYHVEAYIGACLARASELPAQECELLLVDDCGTDGSAALAQAFAREHANARVIRRAQNGGLSAARNTGLTEARGEYVYFLDSDDLPEPQALYAMVCRARDAQLDVVKGRFVAFDDGTGEETPGPALAATDVIGGPALFSRQCRENVYEPMVWQCAYRRAFLEAHSLTMAEGLLFEDELFQAPALLCAARAQAVTDTILRYRQRAGSIMKSFSKNARWCESYLEICRRLRALADSRDADAASRALCRRVGQIALSVAKNIPAYALPPDVAAEAMAFVLAHRRELAGYALRSRDVPVALQGALLALSPRAFVALYSRR